MDNNFPRHPGNPADKLPMIPADAQQRPAEDLNDEINIGEVIATLLIHKWFILGITAVALALGVFAVFIATPIYSANAVIQIEEQKGITSIAQLQPLGEESTSVSAELEIINSRMILGRVVDRLRLDIVAEPRYFPIVGQALARRAGDAQLAEPMLGQIEYAWGGERIRLESLEVSPHLLGVTFTLVAGEAGSFELFDSEDQMLLAGRVGELAANDEVSIFVSELLARPQTQFDVRRLRREDATAALRTNLGVREKARNSGVLEATLQGPDRVLLPVMLDEVLNSYVRQNVERRSAEAENTLKFLETQLPVLKSQLDAAEAAYNSYRQTRGSIDLTLETQSVLRSIVEVDNEIVKLQQQRESLRQNYTPQHPRILALDAQIARLNSRRSVFDGDVSKLPDTQQTALRLKRDVEVSTTLYTGLLNTAQQLRVSKAGTVGDVRVIDEAVAGREPVEPRSTIILALSGLLGVFVALALVWLRRTLRVVVEDPESIEKALGLPVYATIPHSKTEVALTKQYKAGRPGAQMLAVCEPEDDAIESLRSLRTTLHFALLDAARGSILITGPSPGVGKSFVSRNLGAVLAQSGKRVAIIDADMRKGYIHREFNMQREGGLSEYVSGTLDLANIVRPTGIDNLFVITTGRRPPNPSELLMHARFEGLLKQLGEAFDILIIDAPPVLAVSDAAIIGRHVGATLLVARAGMHPIRELEQTVKRLVQAGVQPRGFVFNDLDSARQRYRYGYGGYVYRYSYR